MHDPKSGEHTVTRRAALSMGAGFMLPLTGQCKVSQRIQAPRDFNLFAFKAPRSQSLVVAVTFVENSPSITRWRKSEFEVRLHVNRETWLIPGPKPLQTCAILRSRDGRTFAGRLPELDASVSLKCNAAVLESHALSSEETLHFWAEIFDQDGVRFRVGNPCTAKLVEGDPTLSKMYHASSPDQDRSLLFDAVRERIAVLAAAAGGVADPAAHGRRLAALLLPDVLLYRPTHPAGFTFACRNGRHPEDDTAAFVSTVLKGVVTQTAASLNFRVCRGFPYLLAPRVSA